MGSNKKKILVLVDWFSPGYKAGGPIQSCVNFAFALKNDFDIYVLTTDTDHGEELPYPGIVSGEWIRDPSDGFNIYYAKKRGLGRKELKNVILSVFPDYIYLNHLFSPYFVVYPLWLKYTGKLDAQVVLCPRGALYQSALSVKPYKKMPFISLFRLMGMGRKIIFHATNAREEEAIRKFFPGSKVVKEPSRKYDLASREITARHFCDRLGQGQVPIHSPRLALRARTPSVIVRPRNHIIDPQVLELLEHFPLPFQQQIFRPRFIGAELQVVMGT